MASRAVSAAHGDLQNDYWSIAAPCSFSSQMFWTRYLHCDSTLLMSDTLPCIDLDRALPG